MYFIQYYYFFVFLVEKMQKFNILKFKIQNLMQI